MTTITIDKVRHLRYSANAIADIEEVLGDGFNTLMSSESKVGIRHARAFLWGGLKHEDRRLQTSKGLDMTGGLIDLWYANGGSMDTLYLRIVEALRNDGWLKAITPEEREKIEADMGEVIGSLTEEPEQ